MSWTVILFQYIIALHALDLSYAIIVSEYKNVLYALDFCTDKYMNSMLLPVYVSLPLPDSLPNAKR